MRELEQEQEHAMLQWYTAIRQLQLRERLDPLADGAA